MMVDGELDILFFSRDPGGTNVLVPMIKFFQQNYLVEVYGKDTALPIYKRECIDCQDINGLIDFDENSIEAFLKKKKPKAVVTGTSTTDRSEYYFWKACSILNILCFANVDSWSFYIERFTINNQGLGDLTHSSNVIFFPDYILAIDEEAKEGMINAGIPRERVLIAGYWHFIYQKEILKKKLKKESYSKKKNNNTSEKKKILFLSEGFSELFGDDPNKGFGYNEKTIFLALESSIERVGVDEDFTIIVRPHPKEGVDWWNKIKEESKKEIVIDRESDLLEQIFEADLVTGMQTQCLNDALLVGSKIISIQIGLNRSNPLFGSKHGLMPTAFSEEELDKYILDFIKDELSDCVFEPEKESRDKFINIFQEVIKNVQACNKRR